MDQNTNSNIGRFVTLLSPVFVALAVILANWVQDLINADLDETQLAVFLSTFALGVFGAIAQWLRNRGAWEKEVMGAQQQAVAQVYAKELERHGPDASDPVTGVKASEVAGEIDSDPLASREVEEDENVEKNL